ncbi:MAG: metallophosphoesterase [Winogradskyella sp.]|uniref:metallophosphoesterase n=1 Tax=Winogradskyella sp. TaxID=1883156 RepID=UPI000F3CC177|nr:metallophosphoesterase [Winogradskyella sp.]RNC84847.1 MAG: metallophosphoesterase [Winogradskyella sp.]
MFGFNQIHVHIFRSAILLLCILVCNSSFSQQKRKSQLKSGKNIISSKSKKNKLNILSGADGPYIINDTLAIRVSRQNDIRTSSVKLGDSILVEVDNIDKDRFYINLNSEYNIPKTEYKMPDKLVVLSDIEGNYNALYGLLLANNIIDKDHNWIFGNGHLVINGDIIDRGKNVTQVLWLLYKLDQQSKKYDGKVHVIIGNHEILNLHGDNRYNRGKYINVAQKISGLDKQKEALEYLFSPTTELGKWLSTKNVVEKIGGYIFVHGGLSKDLLDYKLSLKQINQIARSNYHNSRQNQKNETIKFLYGSKGPFWYRGLAKKKLKSKHFDEILKFYNSEKIVVGHTVVDQVQTGYNGRFINIDVKHGKEKFSGTSFALLIINRSEYIIDDIGNKTPLKY